MARTGIFGGFPFDAEIFAEMMQEADYWRNPVIASGIVHEDPSIMESIGTKGNVATLPMYTPLSIFDNNMGALNNDGNTDNTPVDVAGTSQTAMMIQRMKAFKAKDFTKELTGADPIGNVRKAVQNYYMQVWEHEMMNIAAAVMGVSALSNHVTNLAVTSGTIGAANKVTETTLIDAAQAALGDMADGIGLVVMHSKIYAAYQKLGLVNFDKYTREGALTTAIDLPVINGRKVLVTDRGTVDASVSGFPVYKTYLFGEGAFLSAPKTNYENPYYTDYDPKAAAGTEILYTKQGRVLHPNGLSLDVATIAGESPTFAELGASAKWTLKANDKNVRIGLIKSNG